MTWGSDVDALRKVQPGMPLQLPAKTYNAFVDAARDHQQREMSTAANPLRDKDQANIVLVKNESGADRARFDILGVTGPIISRADNVATFQDRIALRGVTPTSAHAGRFVVLVDAIPNGTIGRAYVSGACLARVRMLDEAHTSADVDDGSAAQLVSGESGAASLVWVEPIAERADPAIAWALIRFGGGGGGSVTIEGQLILALLNSVQRFSDQQIGHARVDGFGIIATCRRDQHRTGRIVDQLFDDGNRGCELTVQSELADVDVVIERGRLNEFGDDPDVHITGERDAAHRERRRRSGSEVA
jgi:hypothetical protein